MGKKKKKKPLPEGVELIAENRKARHNYAIEETFEAGLVLVGTEVKSLRDRQVNFGDAYALLKGGEAFLLGLQIQPFRHGTHENHEADRTRKLLLNAAELARLEKKTSLSGYTLVPLRLYFKKGWAKVLLGLGKGKSTIDRRQEIKKRDADRDVRRALRRGGR